MQVLEIKLRIEVQPELVDILGHLVAKFMTSSAVTTAPAPVVTVPPAPTLPIPPPAAKAEPVAVEKWTPERRAMLVNNAGKSPTLLAADISKLPGRPLTAKDITNLRQVMQRQKPTKADVVPPPPPAPPPRPQTVSPPPVAAPAPKSSPAPASPYVLDDKGRVRARYIEIKAWAERFKIKFDGSNMDQVNKMRASLRLPPFICVT